LWSFWLEPASLRLREECIPIAAPLRQPLRIAILTDLHVGSPYNGLHKLDEIVSRTNAAAPDLVLVLGDLVIQGVVGGTFVAPEEIARKLGSLKPRSGTFAVLGNHDAWLGASRVTSALTSHGIEVMEDRAVKVQTQAGAIWLAGVSDFATGRHDVVAALAAVTGDPAPLLVMTHNPDIFPDVPARVNLTIAGHTHGGQVYVPMIGRPIIPSRYGQRFAAGQIIESGRLLYVATGTGTSIIPVRFGVPPTIDVLTVVSSCDAT